MRTYTCNMVAYFKFLNKLYYKTFQVNINITHNTLNQTRSLYKSMNYFAIEISIQKRVVELHSH